VLRLGSGSGSGVESGVGSGSGSESGVGSGSEVGSGSGVASGCPLGSSPGFPPRRTRCDIHHGHRSWGRRSRPLLDGAATGTGTIVHTT
jgi:hypothetical protein